MGCGDAALVPCPGEGRLWLNGLSGTHDHRLGSHDVSPFNIHHLPSDDLDDARPSGRRRRTVRLSSRIGDARVDFDRVRPGGGDIVPRFSLCGRVRTTDGGSDWVGLTAPPADYVAHGAPAASGLPAVDEVRFADSLNGWVFGPALFATHDGARTWRQVDTGGSVISLETSGGYVDAVVSPCTGETESTGALRLEQAPVTGGGFVTVQMGPSVISDGINGLDLSLHSPLGFPRLGLDYLYATENLAVPDGWNAFPDPCASVGFTLSSMVAPNTTTVYSLCSGNGAAGSSTKTVVVTQGGTSTVAGNTPSGGDAEALAATASRTLVVSAASGASFLYRSADGSHTRSTVLTETDGRMGFNDLGFTTSTQGVVIHGIPGPPGNEVDSAAPDPRRRGELAGRPNRLTGRTMRRHGGPSTVTTVLSKVHHNSSSSGRRSPATPARLAKRASGSLPPRPPSRSARACCQNPVDRFLAHPDPWKTVRDILQYDECILG